MIMESAHSIVESDYEGWVAWVDGHPIFEAVPWNARLLPLVAGARELPTRFGGRQTMEWKRVPAEQLTRFELYFARAVYPNQPVIRFDREPGGDVRFIQMKMTGALVTTPARLGLIGYRVGYWQRGRRHPKGGLGFCAMWEVYRDGRIIELEPVRDPFAPKPEGHGYAPAVLGLSG